MRDQETVNAFRRFFKGDDAAVSLAFMIIHIADVWDDLVDLDAVVVEADVHRAFLFAVSGLPRNRFYREHLDELLPLMETGMLNWMASNELGKRKEDTKALEVANVIRHGIGDMFVHMARLIGGMDWAIAVTPEIKLLAQNDALAQYVKE